MVFAVMGLDEITKEMKVYIEKTKPKISGHSSLKKFGRGGGTCERD